MKIAVGTYSFKQATDSGRMTVSDIIPTAKALGYDGIEIVHNDQFPADMAEMAEAAKQLRAQSEAYGLPIIAYMVGNDFLLESVDKCVETLTEELRIAQILGAPAMRHDATLGLLPDGTPVSFEEALPILAEGYRRVTEIAEGMGIRTMIENHGLMVQDAARVKALVEAVDHPNFGWLCDIGNFMCADEVSTEAVKIAAPIAVHAHAKDFHSRRKGEYMPLEGWFPTRGGNLLRGAIIGHGDVNVEKCLQILHDGGYRGWLSAEFEGMEDCIYALKQDLAELRRMTAAFE